MSGLLWHGRPHRLLELVREGTVTLVSSPALLVEFAEVLERPRFDAILNATVSSREKVLAEVRVLTEVLVPSPLLVPVCRNQDDDEILALALAAQVDLIISGDKDLLELGSFEGVAIVTPGEALSRIAAQP